nr:MAG TPA: hypothetical protein [Bacteriophage sp.]
MEKMNLKIQMFASTNKTANYELSQYVGADKPTYLGDYNSDMLKIDTQMKKNADDTASADSKATTAQETATGAQSTATTAQETATEAQTTATNALNKATQNETELNKFNLTNFVSKAIGDITINQGTISSSSLQIASNSDGSIGKIYGEITTSFNNVNGIVTLECDSPLRPSENIYINSLGIIFIMDNNFNNIYPQGVNIGTDGKISTSINVIPTNTSIRFIFHPCLLFMKNFDDVSSL